MKKVKNKSKKGIIIALALVLVAAIAIPRVMGNKKSAYAKEIVKRGNIETYYTFSGNVESKETQAVMSQKMMQISDIEVVEGDKVKKDDILFKTSQGEEIKAKIDGTVSKIYVQEDASVMAGSNLCDIIDFENLQVTIKVDEYDLSSIEIDKEVSVIIGAIDKTITGKISNISDLATNQNGVAYFTATLDLEKDESIKVGMTAEAKMLNNSVKDVLIVPMNVLQFDGDEVFVFVKDDKDLPVEKIVKVGINDGKHVEIREGLEDNQTVMYKKIDSSVGNASRGIVPPMERR